MEYQSSKKDLKIVLSQLKNHLEELKILKCKLKKDMIYGYVKNEDGSKPMENDINTTSFYIYYRKNSFLRLYTTGGLYNYRLDILESIGTFLSHNVDKNGIGMPMAFYNIRKKSINHEPHLEWCLDKDNMKKYVNELKYDTLFDEENISNLIFFEENKRPLDEKIKEIKTMMMLKGIRK